MAMLVSHGYCDDFIDHGAIHSPHPGADYARSAGEGESAGIGSVGTQLPGAYR